MALSDEAHALADRLIARYPQPRSALLPLLHLVQAEHGRITPEGIAFCADRLDLTKAEVQAVQSFYEIYEREDPGDWLITVCTNFSCKVRGAAEIFRALHRANDGLFDPDRGVAVKHLECLGNCEDAPVVQINYQNYGRVTVDEALELLEACRRGNPPPAADGAPPPSFREVCLRLSGATDDPTVHVGTVRGAQADLGAYPKPPAERVFDVHKSLGGPGVHTPGPEMGDTTGVAPPAASAGEVEPRHAEQPAELAEEPTGPAERTTPPPTGEDAAEPVVRRPPAPREEEDYPGPKRGQWGGH